MDVSARVITLVCVLALAAAVSPVHADGLQFGLTPADIELVPAPGGTASGVLVVYNRSSSPVHFRITLQDMYLRPNGVLEVLKPGSTTWTVAGMARVQPAEFDLNANQQLPVRVVVTVPKEARGGLYGVLVVAPSPVLQSGGARGTFVVVVPKLASRLLVLVDGTAVRQGAITNMLVAPTAGGVDAKIVFRNTGNVHVRAEGAVTVLRNGAPVAKTVLEEALVLPGTVHEFRLTVATGRLAAGSYAVRAVIDYGGDVLVAGESTFSVR